MCWKLYLVQLCMKLQPHAYRDEQRYFSVHNETAHLALALWYAIFLIRYMMHIYIYMCVCVCVCAQVKRNAWKHTN